MNFLGLDLNCAPSICDPAKNSLVGGIDELGQVGVRANHAAFAVDHVSPLCGALSRRAQGQEFFLPRPVPLQGFCSTDLSRKFARHRSVPACASGQAVPHGHQEPGLAQYSGRCQREPRLAHLRLVFLTKIQIWVLTAFSEVVCTLATPLKQIVPVVLEIAIQPEGTPIAFTGFPLSTPVPITSVGQIAGYTDVIEGRGPQRILIDKGAGQRASGSPIYNLENGKVVGIMLQRGTGASAGLAFGITSQFIQDFLTNAKVVKENKPTQN